MFLVPTRSGAVRTERWPDDTLAGEPCAKGNNGRGTAGDLLLLWGEAIPKWRALPRVRRIMYLSLGPFGPFAILSDQQPRITITTRTAKVGVGGPALLRRATAKTRKVLIEASPPGVGASSRSAFDSFIYLVHASIVHGFAAAAAGDGGEGGKGGTSGSSLPRAAFREP